jgi:hypothetical protein
MVIGRGRGYDQPARSLIGHPANGKRLKADLLAV